MAEMTAQEAIKLLKRQDNKYLIDYQLHEIAALIEQQQQQIEAQAKRLEAAEKVCDAADIAIKKPGQIKAHWNLTKAMMTWQQVKEGQ